MKLITDHSNINTDEYWEFKESIEETSFETEKLKGKTFGSLETNYNCNKFVYSLFDPAKTSEIRILELGCGGGQFTVDFIKDGHIAIGIDCRPGYKKYIDYAPNWKNYPDNFFLCDIGKGFELLDNNKIVHFDVITSWECFEHLLTKDIDTLFDNINKHSKNGTYFIGSISHKKQIKTHRTLLEKNEWLDKFKHIGFEDTGLSLENKKVREEDQSYYFVLRKNR